MEQTSFFPGVSRRAILSTITLQKDRRIKLNNIRMPLTGEAMQSMPSWLGEAYTSVSQHFLEAEPEIQQISDLAIEFANHAPGQKPATELFESPTVKAPSSEIKRLLVLRTGDADDPEVSLQFTLYAPFSRPLWKWLGEMGGQEVHMSFPSSKPAVEVISPQAQFLAERPELDPKHDSEFDPPEMSLEYEQGVAESLGVPAAVSAPKKGRGRAAGLMVLLCVLSMGFAHAQQPAPTMSETTKLALEGVKKEFGEAQQALQVAHQHLSAIERDIVKDHPGFHLDEATLTIVADGVPKADAKPVPTKPAAKQAIPEPKK